MAKSSEKEHKNVQNPVILLGYEPASSTYLVFLALHKEVSKGSDRSDVYINRTNLSDEHLYAKWFELDSTPELSVRLFRYDPRSPLHQKEGTPDLDWLIVQDIETEDEAIRIGDTFTNKYKELVELGILT